ncbi:hypothetical protein LZ30DRAFT_254468 [Colletotrichum cereale]|nr:hypothetical protein LZ30DRAFT_254468 [Colletotrichum cereale]
MKRIRSWTLNAALHLRHCRWNVSLREKACSHHGNEKPGAVGTQPMYASEQRCEITRVFFFSSLRPWGCSTMAEWARSKLGSTRGSECTLGFVPEAQTSRGKPRSLQPEQKFASQLASLYCFQPALESRMGVLAYVSWEVGRQTQFLSRHSLGRIAMPSQNGPSYQCLPHREPPQVPLP